MNYTNNDLWSVRQIEFLYDALKEYENGNCIYYVDRKFQLKLDEMGTYNYVGALYFEYQDRTILLEQGKNFGLKQSDVVKVLNEKNIGFVLVKENERLAEK